MRFIGLLLAILIFGFLYTAKQTSAVTVPSDQTTRNIKILSLRYFPLDASGKNLDSSITGFSMSLADARIETSTQLQETINALTYGSKYKGYKNPSVNPAFTMTVVDDKEFLASIPRSNYPGYVRGLYRPDYKKILNDLDICNYVDRLGVNQVWVWSYYHDGIEPDESNMSMGRNSQAFWNYGSYGDISNGQHWDDLPVCNKTYVLFNYIIASDLGYILESQGHQIENELSFADYHLFWDLFTKPWGQTGGVKNSCGDIHHAINTTDDYAWRSTNPVSSNCSDWHPDGSGAIEEVNCHTWYGVNCSDDTGAGWKIWWMQNIPGIGNNLTYNGWPLRNWWDFYIDFDDALTRGKQLVNVSTPTPTPIQQYTLTANVYVDVNGNGVQDSGEEGYDGAAVVISGGKIIFPITLTTKNGLASTEFQAGTWNINLITPSDYKTTTNSLQVATLGPNNAQVNFGIQPVSTPTSTPTPIQQYTLTANVYVDVNGNGVQDSVEKGHEGAYLSAVGTYLSTNLSTDSSGLASFKMTPDTFRIHLYVPWVYKATTDVDQVATLGPNNAQVNFGIQPLSTPTPVPSFTPTSIPTIIPIPISTPSAIPTASASSTPVPLSCDPGNVLSQGLVGYWKFDGNTEDSSGNGNNGNAEGAIDYSLDVPGGNSQFGKSATFNGASLVDIGENKAIFDITDKLTLSAWVKISAWDGGQYPTLIHKQASYALGLRASDTRISDVLFSGEVSGRRVWGNPDLEINRWYQMVLTYDKDGGENNVKHYQDGSLIAQMTYGPLDSNLWSSLTLGEGLKGLIDDARVYNRVLSPDEVQLLYNNGAGCPQAGNVLGIDKIKSLFDFSGVIQFIRSFFDRLK